MHKWFVSKDLAEASEVTAVVLTSKILLALEERGVCNILLPGGTTPTNCLSYLANMQLPWKNINWYLGDERCLPVGDKERNDQMLEDVFWSKLEVANTFPIAAENGAEIAAEAYQKLVNKVDQFDIAFLGMGEDGHTASLFPDNLALQDERSVVPVFNSPKPPQERVSMSIETLKNARNRIVLSCGNSKADIIKKIKQGGDYPVTRIGDIEWYIDEAADGLVKADD